MRFEARAWIVAALIVPSGSACGSGGGGGGGVTDPDPPAVSTVRYVGMAGTDNGTCTVQLNPCRTIQYAVGQAASNDEVSILTGSYTGNVVVDKTLTMTGAGASFTTVVGTIEFSASSLQTHTLRRLTVVANGAQETGILIGDDTTAFISDVVVRGFSRFGILASTPRSVSIADSQVLDITGDGIKVNTQATSVLVRRVIVSGSAADGIQVSEQGNFSVAYTASIEDSKIENSGEAGIQFEGWRSGAVQIQGNCIRLGRGEAGIYVTDSSATQYTIRNNNIVRNLCGADVPSSGSRFTMTQNWWGVAAGPVVVSSCSAFNSVKGPIDFVPFATSELSAQFSCPP